MTKLIAIETITGISFPIVRDGFPRIGDGTRQHRKGGKKNAGQAITSIREEIEIGTTIRISMNSEKQMYHFVNRICR